MTLPKYIPRNKISAVDEIILRRYYCHYPLRDIAKHIGTTYAYIKTRIQRLRKRFNLPPREGSHASNTAAFIADKALVSDLFCQGLSIRQIANKYEISHTTVAAYLKDWGVIANPKVNLNELPSINLAGFYTGWRDITEESIITVNKKPKFIVTPLS
jgi:hypothetical protein